jgi:hypothetical protein
MANVAMLQLLLFAEVQAAPLHVVASAMLHIESVISDVPASF